MLSKVLEACDSPNKNLVEEVDAKSFMRSMVDAL